MKATERSDKLPKHVTINLMKICEKCEVSELMAYVDKSILDASTPTKSMFNLKEFTSTIIRCEKEPLCRNLIDQNKELYEKWSEK